MEEPMRTAFEAWARKEARHMDEEEKGYAWLAWRTATAQCSARNDEQLQRLRISLTRLLEVDKQLQDLLPKKGA